MFDVISYTLAKKYVNSSLDGVGAIKGAACQIQSIEDKEDGTHIITFEWEDNNGNIHTNDLTVTDGAQGEQGEQGVGIESIEKTSSTGIVDTYTIYYTDGSTGTFNITNGKSLPEGGTSGQVLAKQSDDDYDADWIDAGGITGDLSGLSDVDINNPTDGQSLVYDAETEKWVNADVSGSGGTNITYDPETRKLIITTGSGDDSNIVYDPDNKNLIIV